MNQNQITSEEQRKATVCIGCGEPKDIGLVVCWHCFKHRQNNYKYSGLGLAEWLESIKEQ